MPSRRVPNHEEASRAVEYLDGVASTPADAMTATSWNWRIAIGIAAVVVLCLGLLIRPNQELASVAELQPIEVYFGDPFDVEWINLDQADEPTAESARPKPMASLEPACIGFARPDWPAESRHPSVAHCIKGESLDQLVDADDVGAWQIVAGTDTWHLLYFPAAIEGLEARVDDGSALGPDQIHHGGPFVAIAIPTSSTEVTLTWSLRTGPAYRCHLDRLSTQPLACA